MEKYKVEEMSSSEIKLGKITLQNEYETVKNKMLQMADKLQELKKEWDKLDYELKKRR